MPLKRVDPDVPSATLFLRTLGGTGLYADLSDDLVLGPGKPLAVLVFLAFAPGRRTSRESLIDLLWSDLDPERARPALRQSLFHLRRLLGEDAISGTEELTLHRPIDADRDQFLVALGKGDLDTSLALYRGAFLPAFGVPGGAAFEHWADLERDRLQAGFMRSAQLVVRRHLNQSRIKEGKQLARRVRDLVPNVEAAGRLVLEASIADGDFVFAAMEANAIEQSAASEGVVLEPATRAAVARARRVVPVAEDDRRSFALVAELTGREQEFFAITSAWEAVRTGPARHLHLSAPAGFGKTRLLRDAVARLAAAGAPVIQLRGTPSDRDVPYAFACDLAAALAEMPGAAGVAPASAATLIALNPALSTRLSGGADTASGEDAPRRRIHAFTDLVHSIADEQRFVLAIDDLHWIDPPSFRVLEGLLGRLSNAHMLCLTASRPERQPSSDSCTHLPLSALTAAQVSALVSALGFIPPHEVWSRTFVAGLHEAARGSPLLVLETLRLALDQGMLSLDGNEWRCLDEVRLASLLRAGEALRERVSALPAPQIWVLAMLATAGTPFERNILAAVVGISRAELNERLEPLERQGLVARTSAGWVPAHDEIAEAARNALTNEQLTLAERCIGEFLSRAAGDDSYGLLRAVRHFVAAGDTDSVARLYRRYARMARARGDRRAFADLAAELVGFEASSLQVTALIQTLPRAWRVGLWSRARQAAAVLALVLVPAAAIGILRARAAIDATTQRLFFVDSTKSTRVIPVRANDWGDRSTPLDRRSGRSTFAEAAAGYPELPPAVSPDGRAAAWIQDSGDSTTLDIWMRTPTGVRRLTHEFRDDLVQGWLPDGSALVGTTNRWSPPGDGDYDIAVFDTASGAARQITRGPSHDTGPFVSPDGTRVAFVRESEDAPPSVCVTTIDGRREPDCRLVGGLAVEQLLGWSGLAELAVILGGQNSRPLVAYDWARNTQRAILGPHVYRGRLSPDRRWAVAALKVDGIRGFRDWIIPLDHPGQARPVANSDRDGGVVRWWEGKLDQSSLIDHIEFSDTSSAILMGIGTRLRIRPLTATNAEIPLYAPVTWTSSDTVVASVDSMGEVRPHTKGLATITASLAGWRSTARRITVAGEPPTTVVDETWDGTWQRRWLAWGDPQPLVVTGPGDIRGFWNNGDGSYPSMAVLKQAFSARHGLGVEMRVSTPFTRTKWQRLRTSLAAGIDTAALRHSDQRKAPPSLGQADVICGMNFPGPGHWGETQLSVVGSIAEVIDLGAAARPLRSGAWWTLRLQILPDGRCGIAINNRVVWLSTEPMPLDAEFRLRLGDESAGTKLLHGPLQVWTGVRTDIDWARRE